MIQEDKDLLLRDLCARLPYGVICDIYNDTCTIKEKLLFGGIARFADDTICVRPYLRPLSSMTEEERKIYIDISSHLCGEIAAKTMIDWLNKNMFDYRGLIEIGLAIEALEGMYKKGE